MSGQATASRRQSGPRGVKKNQQRSQGRTGDPPRGTQVMRGRLRGACIEKMRDPLPRREKVARYGSRSEGCTSSLIFYASIIHQIYKYENMTFEPLDP